MDVDPADSSTVKIYYRHDELGVTLVGELYLDQMGIDDLRERLGDDADADA